MTAGRRLPPFLAPSTLSFHESLKEDGAVPWLIKVLTHAMDEVWQAAQPILFFSFFLRSSSFMYLMKKGRWTTHSLQQTSDRHDRHECMTVMTDRHDRHTGVGCHSLTDLRQLQCALRQEMSGRRPLYTSGLVAGKRGPRSDFLQPAGKEGVLDRAVGRRLTGMERVEMAGEEKIEQGEAHFLANLPGRLVEEHQ